MNNDKLKITENNTIGIAKLPSPSRGEGKGCNCHCEECEVIPLSCFSGEGKYTTFPRRRKAAFTLAEVLITLTIIGVIAAITIPNLMQSWRRHERITQIKTAYSLLNQAVRLSVTENGPTNTWSWQNNGMCNNIHSDAAEKYIFPYLKIQTKCKRCSDDKTLSNKCFDNLYFYHLDGTKTSLVLASAILENGMHLAVEAKATGEMNFIVDVNGKKGRTRYGEDVFAFYLDRTNNLVRTFKGSSYPNVIEDILSSTSYSACNPNAVTENGKSCSRVLELNHWEFPENYPIKKF